MKSLRLYGVHDLRLVDEPMPVPQPDQVLLKVTSVGICGSDVHWYSEGHIGGTALTQPLVIGHEFSAIPQSGEFAGQRVAVEPAISCGKCQACLEGNPNLCPHVRFAGTSPTDGAFSEYLAWPAENLFPLPDSVSDEEGTLLEPFGVGLHALALGPIKPGEIVAVLGCGPVGLLIIQLARLAGATQIYATDVLPNRLKAALSMGATEVFQADTTEREHILALTHKWGVDVCYEAAGDPEAVETAMHVTKPGGRVVLIGIPKEDNITFTASIPRRKGLTLMMCRRMKHTYPRAIRLAASGRVDLKSLITERYPFSQSLQAFKAAENRDGLKVIINMD